MKLVQFSVPSPVLRRFAVTAAKVAAGALALLVLLPYAWSPIYTFPPSAPFAGAHFFNPYANLHGTWQRGNLHAHGRAWSGITNGQQPDEEVVARYQSLGYTVAGVSDYERIATFHGVPTIPLYEHGYNIGKHHQLAIGAHRVEWFDVLLLQSLSQEQYIIDRVRRGADLVAIAHPSLRSAYSIEDMRSLTGYQLVEVVNGPDEQGGLWDAALSSGHTVWALANDDTHDVTDERRTGAAWNMIDAPSASTSDVIAALRAGRAYAVARRPEHEGNDTLLASVTVDEGRVVVTCSGAPGMFEFVGQDGNIRATAPETLSASYTFRPEDTYIRTVIRTPATTMYLNPVIRYDGARLPTLSASVDEGATWLVRGASLAAGLALVAVVRSRRPPAPRSAPAAIEDVAPPKRKTA
jgi:hypothetical protein